MAPGDSLKRPLDTAESESSARKRQATGKAASCSVAGTAASSSDVDMSPVDRQLTAKKEALAPWRYLIVVIVILACVFATTKFYLPTNSWHGLGSYWLPAIASGIALGTHLLEPVLVSKGVVLARESHLIVRMAMGVTTISFGMWVLVKIEKRQYLPPLPDAWVLFFLGLGTLAVIAFVMRPKGTKQKTTPGAGLRRMDSGVEPAPPATVPLAEPDWASMYKELSQRGNQARVKHLETLRRIYALSSEDAVRRTIAQEAVRLYQEGSAEASQELGDWLDDFASLVQWGAQKLPELLELNTSDILLAKVVADIQSQHSAVRTIYVDHRQLRAIHPIDRQTAIDKCEERAAAARAALPTIESNGMKLSEALIASNGSLSDFQSVTGFQVVAVPNGYVTFEGNGRREALVRAFGGKNASIGVLVEVRLFEFPNLETSSKIASSMEYVRRSKNVVDV